MAGGCKSKVSCGVFQLLHRQLFFAYDLPLSRLSQPLRLCPGLLCQRNAQALCFCSPLFEETSNVLVGISKHLLMLHQELFGFLTRPLCFFERVTYSMLTLFQSSQDRSPCHFAKHNQ